MGLRAWWRRARRQKGEAAQEARSGRRQARDGKRQGSTTHPKGRPIQAASGLWVRSGGERRIANWLDDHGLPYAYEAEVAGLRPDFHLPDQHLVIEYWGMAGHRGYDRRMAEKTARYEAAGLQVVHVLPLNLRDLDEVLGELLARGRDPAPPGHDRPRP